jgi:hypothetical protein
MQGLPVKTAAGEVVFVPNKQQQRLMTAAKVQVEGVTVQDDLLQQQEQQPQREKGGKKGRESAGDDAEVDADTGSEEEEGTAAAATAAAAAKGQKAAQQAQAVAPEQQGMFRQTAYVLRSVCNTNTVLLVSSIAVCLLCSWVVCRMPSAARSHLFCHMQGPAANQPIPLPSSTPGPVAS